MIVRSLIVRAEDKPKRTDKPNRPANTKHHSACESRVARRWTSHAVFDRTLVKRDQNRARRHAAQPSAHERPWNNTARRRLNAACRRDDTQIYRNGVATLAGVDAVADAIDTDATTTIDAATDTMDAGVGDVSVDASSAEDASTPAEDAAPRTYAIDLHIFGPGHGEITSAPPGIACPPTCRASFADGAEVTLAATPDQDSEQAEWSGDCSGKGDCPLMMAQDMSVAAYFGRRPASISIAVVGSGTGTIIDESGLRCESECSSSGTSGVASSFEAEPDPGSEFKGWFGGCSGTDPTCELTLHPETTVRGVFDQTICSYESYQSASPLEAALTVDGDATTSMTSGTQQGWQSVEIDLGCAQQISALRRQMLPTEATASRAQKGERWAYSTDAVHWTSLLTSSTTGWNDYPNASSSAWESLPYGWSPWIRLNAARTARFLKYEWEANHDGIAEIERDARFVTSDRAGTNGTTPWNVVDGDTAVGFQSGYNDWQYVVVNFGRPVQLLRLRRNMNGPWDRNNQGESIEVATSGSSFQQIVAAEVQGWEAYPNYGSTSAGWHSVTYGWSPWLELKTPRTVQSVKFRWDGNSDILEELDLDYAEIP